MNQKSEYKGMKGMFSIIS